MQRIFSSQEVLLNQVFLKGGFKSYIPQLSSLRGFYSGYSGFPCHAAKYVCIDLEASLATKFVG